MEGLHFQVEGGSLGGQELLVGAIHGAALAAAVFLAGLVAFAALVWLPAWRAGNVVGQDAVNLLARLTWPLFGLLTVAGFLEVSLYAVRASGEAFGPGLFGEALFRTWVGNVWLARVVLAYLTAFTATRAAKEGRRDRPTGWWRWAAAV